MVAQAVDSGYKLYNANHDAKGRFASGGGSGAGGSGRAGRAKVAKSPEEKLAGLRAREARLQAERDATERAKNEAILHGNHAMRETSRLMKLDTQLKAVRTQIHNLQLGPEGRHAAKAAKLKAALDKAQAAYDAHMAKAPKLASERGAHDREAARLLADVQTLRVAYRAALVEGRESNRGGGGRGGLMGAPGYGGAIQLGEVGADGFHRSWIMLFPEGEYEHPQYGKLRFTQARLAEIKAQFDERVRHIDIALDANHDQDKATGWLERLELRERRGDGEQGQPAGLWGYVRWTPYGAQLLKDQLYRYFSPEFGPWEDPQSGKKYDDVLIGGGLTNRPFLKEMPAVTLADGTAVSRKPWGSVNKSMLPRSSFLIQGDPAKKSTWRLPVYEGAGPKDADGCYTKRGPLNINAVRAALAALGGARTGKAMTGVPSGVKAKLEGWLKQYGGDSQQAREPAAVTHGGVEAQATMLEFDEETQSFADSGEDEDEGMSYADGDGDDDGDGFDAGSDTHGAITTDGHSHGKFGDHSHDGDGDHSDAPLKRGGGKQMSGGAKKASERMTSRQLREAYDAQQRQLSEMREQLYMRDVAETLAGWEAGKFQFSEAPKSGGKALPMVALSRAFTERYRAFMLSEGARLSSGERKALGELIETALSAAVVDLSQRGASFDQEKRRTLRGGRAGERERELEGVDVMEQAQQLAEARYHKAFDELGYETKLNLLNEVTRG